MKKNEDIYIICFKIFSNSKNFKQIDDYINDKIIITIIKILELFLQQNINNLCLYIDSKVFF